MSQILLVEPDGRLARTVTESLTSNNHTVHLAETAQAAIIIVDDVRPNIIILELQLPVHNGVEFLYELRSYADCQNIPVLIYSNIPPTIEAISPLLWRQLGISAYLYKPLAKLTDIIRTIDDVLPLAA